MGFYKLVINKFPRHFEGRVLDIGSLDINGGPHLLLQANEYLGVDIGPGKNVNLVCHGEDLELPTNSFDVAMSSECFEHNKNWRATLHNMIRMTKPGGVVVFSCASTGREEHGTSASDGGFSAPLLNAQGTEYYQNVARRDVVSTLHGSGLGDSIAITDRVNHDLLFVGIKGESNTVSQKLLSGLRREIQTEIRSAQGKNPSASRSLLIFAFGDVGRDFYKRIKGYSDDFYRFSVRRVKKDSVS